MKIYLFTFLVLIGAAYNLQAQNRVTIKQTGNNNSATVAQSASTDSIAQHIIGNNPCYKINHAKQKKGKNVITLKAQNSHLTNHYTVAGRSHNKLYITQNGDKAQQIGFIKNIDTLAAKQQGTQNGIVLYVGSNRNQKSREGNSYHLTQKGTANAIYMGPCKRNSKDQSPSAHNIEVTQEGSGNSAHIVIGH